jgi:hypothetical protein
MMRDDDRPLQGVRFLLSPSMFFPVERKTRLLMYENIQKVVGRLKMHTKVYRLTTSSFSSSLLTSNQRVGGEASESEQSVFALAGRSVPFIVHICSRRHG